MVGEKKAIKRYEFHFPIQQNSKDDKFSTHNFQPRVRSKLSRLRVQEGDCSTTMIDQDQTHIIDSPFPAGSINDGSSHRRVNRIEVETRAQELLIQKKQTLDMVNLSSCDLSSLGSRTKIHLDSQIQDLPINIKSGMGMPEQVISKTLTTEGSHG